MSDIDRIPTKVETFVGAIFALILSGGLGFILFYVFRFGYDRPEALTPANAGMIIALAIIFAWTSSLFLRIIFGSPKRPSYIGQSIFGWLTAILGATYCIGSLLSDNNPSIQHAFKGFVIFTIGMFWVNQARNSKRS